MQVRMILKKRIDRNMSLLIKVLYYKEQRLCDNQLKYKYLYKGDNRRQLRTTSAKSTTSQ